MSDRLVPATFVARPNRFIVRAALNGLGEVESHLADPGRLEELLLPGAELRLRPALSGKRKTRYTVSLVRSPAPRSVWVCVEAARANQLAEALLTRGAVRGLGRGWSVEREVPHGRSRFDFLLRRTGQRLWVEVKSVTLVRDGVGLFPDAPTVRGRRHVEELTLLAGRGDRALILFVVQRTDARMVTPHRGIDPEFSDALSAARRGGVRVRAVRFRPSPSGRISFVGPLPVR